MESIIFSIQTIYVVLGVDATANNGDILGIGCFLLISMLSLSMSLKKPAAVAKKEEKEKKAETTATAPEISWKERLNRGLARSRQEVWNKFNNIIGSDNLSDAQLEEIEELLYSSDIGTKTVAQLISTLKDKMKKEAFDLNKFKLFLYQFLKNLMGPTQERVDVENSDLFKFTPETEKTAPTTIMVVGVNGAGKTTTIGKLATRLTRQGASVVVGACDTFRAAAVEQLSIWCERSGAQLIKGKDGAAPSGVAYETLQVALNSGADYCILDTAGRLHTKTNLMDELKKSKKVLSKLDETAPHHRLLVIDAITGQNAIRQAEEFNKALDLTGIILTKCDGSSKAGGAVSIVETLKVPIAYVGVGEEIDDLNAFKLDEYLGTLLEM